MPGFTPRPANQKAAQGEEASRGITNGSEEGGAKCVATVHRELLRINDDDMIRIMWISVLRK